MVIPADAETREKLEEIERELAKLRFRAGELSPLAGRNAFPLMKGAKEGVRILVSEQVAAGPASRGVRRYELQTAVPGRWHEKPVHCGPP